MKIEPCKIDLSMLEGKEREEISVRIQKCCFEYDILYSDGSAEIFEPGGEMLSIAIEASGLLNLYNEPWREEDWFSYPEPEITWGEFLAKYERVEDNPVITGIDPAEGSTEQERMVMADFRPLTELEQQYAAKIAAQQPEPPKAQEPINFIEAPYGRYPGGKK